MDDNRIGTGVYIPVIEGHEPYIMPGDFLTRLEDGAGILITGVESHAEGFDVLAEVFCAVYEVAAADPLGPSPQD